jgi:hypothetical protein
MYVFDLLAMHLPGRLWKESKLAYVEHVLDMLGMHLPGSRWKGSNLASAVHVLKLLALHLVESCLLCQEPLERNETYQRRASTRIARNASAREPLGRINLASAVPVFAMLAMRPPGSRWEEIELASAEHVLGLLAMHPPGSRWKGTNLASAVPPSNCLQCIWQEAVGKKTSCSAEYLLELLLRISQEAAEKKLNLPA